MNQSTSIDAKQNPANPNADAYKAIGQSGSPIVELFMGWGKMFGGYFYGGLEGKIDLVLGGNQKVAEDSNFIYKAGPKRIGIGALVRLGYLITPTTMIYGGIGVKALRFDHDLFEKAEGIPAPFSQKALNLLTELGIETAVGGFEHLRFRLAYTFMPKKSTTCATNQFPANHIYRNQGVLKIGGAEHALKIGILHRF